MQKLTIDMSPNATEAEVVEVVDGVETTTVVVTETHPQATLVDLSPEEIADAQARTEAEAAALLAARPMLIKAEAGRRILAAFPSWRQTNMTARQAELSRIQLGQMRDETGALLPARVLTADETAEEIAIAAAWAWVVSVRAASNALEASLPADYTADVHWPSNPV